LSLYYIALLEKSAK